VDLTDLKVHPALADWRVTCVAAPVQIEGALIDGRWFYFRARHDAATVGLSRHSPDEAVRQTLLPSYRVGGVDSRADGRAYAMRRGVEGAGWLAPQEAHDMLGSLLTDIRDYVMEAVTWS
jgi:hypothetical protein